MSALPTPPPTAYAFNGVESARTGRPTIHHIVQASLAKELEGVPSVKLPIVEGVPSVELPIVKSTKKCLVDANDAKWFDTKELHFGREGVYFYHPNTKTRKYYVHNQVMIIATIEGKQPHPQGPAGLREFVRKLGAPDVAEFYQQSVRK